MKNYSEFRGIATQVRFISSTGVFVVQEIPHPFLAQIDSHSERMLADIGLDSRAFACGKLKLMAKDLV